MYDWIGLDGTEYLLACSLLEQVKNCKQLMILELTDSGWDESPDKEIPCDILSKMPSSLQMFRCNLFPKIVRRTAQELPKLRILDLCIMQKPQFDQVNH